MIGTWMAHRSCNCSGDATQASFRLALCDAVHWSRPNFEDAEVDHHSSGVGTISTRHGPLLLSCSKEIWTKVPMIKDWTQALSVRIESYMGDFTNKVRGFDWNVTGIYCYLLVVTYIHPIPLESKHNGYLKKNNNNNNPPPHLHAQIGSSRASHSMLIGAVGNGKTRCGVTCFFHVGKFCSVCFLEGPSTHSQPCLPCFILKRREYLPKSIYK